mmetsp:Transcript_55374/g.121561  ORF Transcript_55374/g.121561 Transcript_55374/m.121561 type:complete len:275 (+) Transcript_55374:417-1241(+)
MAAEGQELLPRYVASRALESHLAEDLLYPSARILVAKTRPAHSCLVVGAVPQSNQKRSFGDVTGVCPIHLPKPDEQLRLVQTHHGLVEKRQSCGTASGTARHRQGIRHGRAGRGQVLRQVQVLDYLAVSLRRELRQQRWSDPPAKLAMLWACGQIDVEARRPHARLHAAIFLGLAQRVALEGEAHRVEPLDLGLDPFVLPIQAGLVHGPGRRQHRGFQLHARLPLRHIRRKERMSPTATHSPQPRPSPFGAWQGDAGQGAMRGGGPGEQPPERP